MYDDDTFTVFNLKYNDYSDPSHAQFQGSKAAFVRKMLKNYFIVTTRELDLPKKKKSSFTVVALPKKHEKIISFCLREIF